MVKQLPTGPDAPPKVAAVKPADLVNPGLAAVCRYTRCAAEHGLVLGSFRRALLVPLTMTRPPLI